MSNGQDDAKHLRKRQEKMIITADILEQGKSRRNGWSNSQIRALGVPGIKTTWRNKGWKKRIIGVDVPAGNIRKFLALKDVHLRKKMQEQCETLLFSEPTEDLSHILSIRQELRSGGEK